MLYTACSEKETKKVQPVVLNGVPKTVLLFVEDENQQSLSDPNSLVYEARRHSQVSAPDGHQLSLAEFSRVKGRAEVSCTDNGTLVKIELSGLVPNGVYTIWNVTLKAPGLDPEAASEMHNIIGKGALGDGHGTQNIIVASKDGKGSVSALTPEGPLSMVGKIGACSLTDEFEYRLLGALHLDGKTYGPDMGPEGTVVEQFSFIFTNDN